MKTPLSSCEAAEIRLPTIMVAAVSLLNAEGKVLLQQRPEADAHGGLWEFPGGKLESGESFEAGVVREIAEELDLIVRPENLTPVTFATGAAGNADRSITILLFCCRIWDGEPKPLAAAQLAWMEPAMIGTLAMPPLDYPLAERLNQILESGFI